MQPDATDHYDELQRFVASCTEVAQAFTDAFMRMGEELALALGIGILTEDEIRAIEAFDRRYERQRARKMRRVRSRS